MSNEKIKVFVEGANDLRFLHWVICRYYNIYPIQYQQKRNKLINTYIKQAQAKEDQDYIFLADLDSHSFPCVTSKKTTRMREYSALDDKLKIIIVKEEIESWYVSGICDKCPDDIRNIPVPNNTENFTKENFEEIIPSTFDSTIDFMIEIGKCFDLELAKNRNDSFNRLIKKLNEFNIRHKTTD